ncbi:hypothetical protein RUM44_001724 [Polyplax serrata]|uniref:G-protein coupled receptors family 3 profile domain-containing protein n=1 Tax=Polyplax serrata TaxID=468196 RepID=A0ABR1AKW2_POLSC
MKFVNYFTGLYAWIFYGVIGQSLDKFKNNFNLVFDRPGNITVTGVFNGIVGTDCNLQSSRALEEMASTIWIVEALNNYNFLHGITIGLSMFESCERDVKQQSDLLEALWESSKVNNNTFNTGILTTFDVDNNPDLFKQVRNSTYQVQHIADPETLIDITVQLLGNLQWTTVDFVFSDSDNILNMLSEKGTTEGINIGNELLIDDVLKSHLKHWRPSEDVRVVVVLSEFRKMVELFDSIESINTTKLILVPTDLLFRPWRAFPKESMVLLPSIGDENILIQFIRGSSYHRDFFNHREPTRSPLFVGIAVSILKLLHPLRNVQNEFCRDVTENPCPEVIDFIKFRGENKTNSFDLKSCAVLPEDVENVFETLNLEPNSNTEASLYIANLAAANGPDEDAAIFQLFNLKNKNFHPILMKINENVLHEPEFLGKPENVKSSTEKTVQKDQEVFVKGLESEEEALARKFLQEYTVVNQNAEYEIDDQTSMGLDSIKNIEKQTLALDQENQNVCRDCGRGTNASQHKTKVTWRLENWVTVNATMGTFGFLCTIGIMAFILGRMCKGDALEGSPVFILCLMFVTTLMYTSSVAFHVKPIFNIDDVTCSEVCLIRMFAPSFMYSLLFALMLSRSFMLAFSESGDGFISHINGYLQSILFLALLGIQISITTQNWLNEKNGFLDPDCSALHVHNKIVASFVYNFVLLVLLIFVSPFIVRYRRNYREGLLLGISAFAILLIWTAWIASYFLVPIPERDSAIAIGLNSTATVLLIFAFIPRTYLMAAAIVRCRTSTCLPTVDRHVLPNVSDLNYKSNRVGGNSQLENDICETFNIGVLNPNFMQ